MAVNVLKWENKFSGFQASSEVNIVWREESKW